MPFLRLFFEIFAAIRKPVPFGKAGDFLIAEQPLLRGSHPRVTTLPAMIPSGVEYIYENQWKLGNGPWLEKFPRENPHFSDDCIRGGFSDEGGLMSLSKEYHLPPGNGTVWTSAWQVQIVEMSDKEGWVYGEKFIDLTKCSHNVFLESGVRRRRWRRYYGPPGSVPSFVSEVVLENVTPHHVTTGATLDIYEMAPGCTSIASSPPANARQSSGGTVSSPGTSIFASLSALLSTLPIRKELEPLQPSTVSSDLEGLSRALHALKRGASTAAARSGSLASPPSALENLLNLQQCAKTISQRLYVLEKICARGLSRDGGRSGLWTRLVKETEALQKAAGEEIAKISKARGLESASKKQAILSEASSEKKLQVARHQADVLSQAQLQLSEADWALTDAEERGEEIRKIAEATVEVHGMFKDVAQLIEGQSASIAKLEENVASAREHAQAGVDKIKEAEAIHRSRGCVLS